MYAPNVQQGTAETGEWQESRSDEYMRKKHVKNAVKKKTAETDLEA